MRDLLRFILLILFLPVIIVVLGPALVLAAIKGRQWLGPVTLNTYGYNVLGRTGVFLLGVAIWLLVWSGLVWFTIQALTPVAPSTVGLASTPTPTAAATASPAAPAETPTATPEPTHTPVPPKPLATPPSTPTATRVLSTNTPTPQLTELTATRPATATPEPGVTTTTTAAAAATVTDTASPAKTGTLTPADRRAALVAVTEANELLRDAIAQATNANVENLGKIWQGKALDVIERFAIRLNDRYARPLDVTFEYVLPPEIGDESRSDEVVVSTREKWSYGGSSKTTEEMLEFIYTLAPKDDAWVITRYTYRNLATPPRPPTITPTPTLEY